VLIVCLGECTVDVGLIKDKTHKIPEGASWTLRLRVQELEK
jgi:hypothetical protein